MLLHIRTILTLQVNQFFRKNSRNIQKNSLFEKFIVDGKLQILFWGSILVKLIDKVINQIQL